MKGYSPLIVAVSICLCATLPADDTDIYLSTDAARAGDAWLMFTLDWHPRLTDPVCSASECDFLIAEGYLAAAPTTRLELLRAVLRKSLRSRADLRVGLMISHQQEPAIGCAGPGASALRCSGGAYVLKGFTDVEDDEALAGGADSFFARLDALPLPGPGQAHPYQGAELLFELFRYLTGQGVHNGPNGWNDWGTNALYNIDQVEDTPGAGAELAWDPSVESPGARYVAPALGACDRLFTVNFLFQHPALDRDSDSAIREPRANGGLENIDLGSPDNATSAFAAVIDTLHRVDLADGGFGALPDLDGRQNVTSFVIVDAPILDSQAHEVARAGGSGTALALSSNPRELLATLDSVFSQIQSMATTFVAPVVAGGGLARAPLGAETFVTLFRPDIDGKPLWPGNLKRLALIDRDPGPAQDYALRDALGENAVDRDGRLRPSALTFWTHPEDVPEPPALPPGSPASDFETNRDGRSVVHGGAGGIIPGYRPRTDRDISGYHPGLRNPVGAATAAGPRRVLTEDLTGLSPSGLMDLEVDDATAALLANNDPRLFKVLLPDSDCRVSPCADYATAAPGDRAEAVRRASALIAWIRGLTDANGDGDYLDDEDVRPWLMGDPLHSRPLVLDYGTRGAYTDADNPDLRIVVGDNSGHLHLLRNNLPGPAPGEADGSEAWSFVPLEILPTLVRLQHNTPGIPIHPYTVDGSASVLRIEDGDGALDEAHESLWGFFGLRRGGKRYYALDLSDPDAPQLLWTLSKGPPGSAFAELAQSWSVPNPRTVLLDTDANPATPPLPIPVLIFGGGYNGDDGGDRSGDLGKDARAAAGASAGLFGADDDEGNALFVVDAQTGALLWKAVKTGIGASGGSAGAVVFEHPELRDSIAATVSLANLDGRPGVDRGYVGDTGGTLWRLDLASPDPANWRFERILLAGRHFNPAETDDRRFFASPSIVPARDAGGSFDAVVIASGDRAHPLGRTVDNWLYLFKDRRVAGAPPPDASATLEHDDLLDLSDNCLQDTDSSDCSGDVANLQRGWRIRLEQCAGNSGTGACGEKGLAAAFVQSGTVFVNTYLPSEPLGCAPSEGEGRAYALDLQTAAAVFSFDTSNDAPDPTPERSATTAAPGIPVEDVPTGQQILHPDLSLGDVRPPGNEQPATPTFWYQPEPGSLP